MQHHGGFPRPVQSHFVAILVGVGKNGCALIRTQVQAEFVLQCRTPANGMFSFSRKRMRICPPFFHVAKLFGTLNTLKHLVRAQVGWHGPFVGVGY